MSEIADMEYLNMELAFPMDRDRPKLASDSKPIGIANDNPILDTRMFEVEFLEGIMVAMLVNTIAENLYAQIDSAGHWQLILDEIINLRATKEAV